jgi:peptidoglycan hydrolase-like protein with peptidoglycan-binding domain
MRQTLGRVAFALVLGLFSPLASAQTQTPPTAPSTDAAAIAARKAAFLALPEATRKAVQEALVWLGLYVGVDDGEFGKRTHDAILAFQGNVKAPADGALSPPLLNALLAAAQKAREAVGFQIVSDPKTGAKIGAPLKLLNARGGARLAFASNADADLGGLYTRLSTATPTRKITYKAIKPEGFFVVSGEEGPVKFYTRFDKNPDATPPIRGFTFAYPASQTATLDRVAIAIANSFAPFPESATTPAPSAGASAAAPPASNAAPPPAAPSPAATALIVAPGKALTALKTDDCPNPTVAGKPVRIERKDAATGLTILAGDFASNGEAPRLGSPSQDLVILGFSGPRLAASSASFASDEARPIVTAALDKSADGAPAFSRSGALVGLVAPIAGEPRRVAGVALAGPHALIAQDALRAFLGVDESSREQGAPLSAGDIAAREKKALVAVFCQK